MKPINRFFMPIAISMLVVIGQVSRINAKSYDDVLRNYQPLAMDESWKLTGGSSTDSDFVGDFDDDTSVSFGRSTPAKRIKRPKYSDESLFELSEPKIKSLSTKSLKKVSEWQGDKSTKDVIFEVPYEQTPALTRLIAGTGKPTFMSPNISRPIMNSKKGSKVIASYKIMIPIWIPSIKKRTTMKPVKKEEPITETVTEYVPVKKIVPHMREIVKAERVPQELITDFVETSRKRVPTSVDDKLQLNERLVDTVVENID